MPEIQEQETLSVPNIIVDSEGAEWLSGYKLPPDNDSMWEPSTYSVAITHCVWNNQEELVDVYTSYEKVESILTNAAVRRSNMRLIMEGHSPLFVKWADVAKIAEPQEEERNTRSIRGRLGRLFGIKKLD